jgi:hypothetical protein
VLPAWLADRVVRLLPRLAALAIEDLLEDLAHARSQELALLGRGVVIPTPDPGGLPGVEVLGIHVSIVRRAKAAVKVPVGLLQRAATKSPDGRNRTGRTIEPCSTPRSWSFVSGSA